ncbi:hypothetical protein NW767_006309 [Fusarium falciforme]|nr:hypothetical protein NW767_006309 [Fusarium falciforme]
MGGNMEWGEYGQVTELVKGYGLDGDAKPLFSMKAEALSLFELGDGQYFLYNAIEASLCQIKSPSDLQTIALAIDDENRGLGALEIEAI